MNAHVVVVPNEKAGSDDAAACTWFERVLAVCSARSGLSANAVQSQTVEKRLHGTREPSSPRARASNSPNPKQHDMLESVLARLTLRHRREHHDKSCQAALRNMTVLMVTFPHSFISLYESYNTASPRRK